MDATNLVRSLNVQQLLNRQLTVLGGDEPYNQEEEYPTLKPVKVPDLKAITIAQEANTFKARLRAYALLCKAFKRGPAESISEAQQLIYLQSLKRDLSPIITNFTSAQPPKPNAALLNTPMGKLHQYLYVSIIDRDSNPICLEIPSLSFPGDLCRRCFELTGLVLFCPILLLYTHL